LRDYGRNRKERKEYIHQSGLLLAGVDVSKAKYDAGNSLGNSSGKKVGETSFLFSIVGFP